MLIATEDKMRDLLNLLWLNTDKIRHIETVDCPSRFGEPTESKISIQMMCQIKGKEDALFSLNALPTIDSVPVVRCKDCKYWGIHKRLNLPWCFAMHIDKSKDGYCDFAERREDATN